MALIPVESVSSYDTRQWEYDVFLNFQGEDTGNSFTDHLYFALKQERILTFRDDEKLQRGSAISLALLEAIEESRISVIILSRRYAFSTWCLDELVKILKCKEEKGQIVFPVFYDVDPSYVRKQIGSFAEAFAMHEERFKENLERVQTWRSALSEVANLSGFHLQDRPESQFIQQIVEVILDKLATRYLNSIELLVGMDSRVEEIFSYLGIGLTDVRIVGICGIGGVGKSTIARVAYDRLFGQFEASCFLANIREVAQKFGLIFLQEILLSTILKERVARINGVLEGVKQIRNRLHRKRILLVLDDVDQLEQLNILAGERDFFGLGSRIIITSRDKNLLRMHNVDQIYEPEKLSNEEALELFSLKSFNRKHPPKDYIEMSNLVVNYIGGLPLALKVIGSSLYQKTYKEWKSALGKILLYPERKNLDVFKISFDGLDYKEKEIFLHIACFFEGMDKDRVIEILGYLGLYVHYGLQILIVKSLLEVSLDNRLCMHYLIQEMGREIVRQECVKEPGRRSRLWTHEDIDHVLRNNTGTEAIGGIFLELPLEKEVQGDPEAFSKFSNLKLLKIGNMHLPHGLAYLPRALRFLDWSHYPLKSLPATFQPDQLVELNMCHSKIELLWETVKYSDNLKFIKLSHSQNLRSTPNFTGIPNLQILDLEGCTNLIEVDPSVGVLKRLTLLNLKDCIRLTRLPSKIETESLEIFILSGCSKIKKISNFGENMQQLQKLYLNGTAIKTLPSSIEHLTGLILLDLSHCKNLLYLPRTIIRLESLREFIVSGCSKLAKFEDHETASTHELEIELSFSKTPEPSRAHETKDVEISSGAQTESVFSQIKGESQMSKLTMHVKEPIEPPTPLAVSTSGTNKGATVEPFLSESSKLFELPDPETKPISLEKPELLYAHGTKVMEKKGKMSIPETEIEIVPPQPTEEGTSKQAAMRPKQTATMLPSGKDEIEIAPTDSQLLLEVSTYSKRSIERTSLEILEYMNDVTARRIGFHGSDEIGRTSVLKALISNPKIKDLFDMVIWVTVSRHWSTRKVQDEVLRQLPLASEDFNTDFEITGKLLQVLRSQWFLLILDDVWEPIDLNAVGIPDPALKKGCKMIFSTRFQNVCHVMGADREVQMEGLLPEEAWKLFQKLVGEIIDSPNIQKFARAIVQKCHGLPLLIIVTGRALAKENDALAWMHASKEFSQCSAHGIYGYEALIQKLKFSYDRLEGPDVKRCFLYCALFPEDQEISIDELVHYWIQEGLVAGNRPDSYKRGLDIVDILVGASLLQIVQVGLSIKMHNLIRDLASRILSLEVEGCQFLCGSYSKMTQLSHMGNRLPILEYHRFLSRAGAGLIELPLKEEWEEAKMIFLMDNELTSLPERPNSPRLLALFLQRNHNLRVIPTSFFDLMPSLTILNLSKTRIKFLPKSICKLTILEVLILRDCERLVQLPSEVGSLRRLVVLDLQGTKLNQFLNEISELVSLRHLKLSFYGSVNRSEYDNLPRELLSHVVIRNLSELETLSIDVYPGDMRWNENMKSVIVEVSNLTNLTTFCCYFPKVEFLEFFLQMSATWKIGGLTEFKFVVGHDVKRFASQNVDNLELDYVQWGQCLRFVNGEMIPNAVLEVLTRTSAFCLDHHINVCSLSEFGLSNFNGLRLCVVRECPEIQTIISSMEISDAVFPILEHLSINDLPDLTMICKEMIPQGSFAKLRVLTVYTCPNLEFVFASSMVQCFSNLEELIVEDCSAIKKIVDSDSGTLPSLKRLKLHSLPNLVDIMKGAWPPLENISFYDCPMLKKLGINSNLIGTIKEIKAEKDWWEELEWQDSSLYSRLQARFTLISDEDL